MKKTMCSRINKEKSLNLAFGLLGSLAIQIGIVMVLSRMFTEFNRSSDYKKMTVSLVLPKIEETVSKAEVVHKALIDKTFDEHKLQKAENIMDRIVPDDPFESIKKIEKPVIPIAAITKAKEKKQTRIKADQNAAPLVVDKAVDKEANIISEPKDEVIENNSPDVKKETKEEKPVQKKPVLTKRQLDANSNYLSKVMRVFEKNKKYPSEARKRHMVGTIVVAFAIGKDGSTGRVKAKTLEPPLLVAAAEELIKNSRLPKPPDSWPVGALIEIPIKYSIK